MSDEADLATEQDVPPALSFWKKFKWELQQNVSSQLKVTILSSWFICSLIMTWCFVNNDPAGLALSLLMTIGTLWVSDSNEDPYS